MRANKNATPGWHREAAGRHTNSQPNHTAKLFTIGDAVDPFRAAATPFRDALLGNDGFAVPQGASDGEA